MEPIVMCAIFLTTFTVLLIIYLWTSEYFAMRDTLGFIPGPRSYPFVGHSLLVARVAVEDRFEWFNELCSAYELGMLVIWLGTVPFVNIRKPHQIEVILQSTTYIKKTKMYKILKPWLGKGLLTSSGSTWGRHKRIIAPAINIDMFEQYTSVIYKKVNVLIKQIQGKMQVEPRTIINIVNFANKYAFDTICEIALGIDMDTLRKSQNTYTRAISSFCQLATERYFRAWTTWDFTYFRTKKGRKMINIVKILHNFTDSVIRKRLSERRQQTLESEEYLNQQQESERKSFLDFLLDKNERIDNPLTFEEIREEMDTFIFIGYNTVAAAITWTLFALGNARKVQAKLHNELNEILGDSENLATIEQLEQLHYLDRVIKESLRLYPSIPIIGRSLHHHVVIDNFYIPSGTIINMQIYQLHHDPTVWEDPETFDPDRFLPENSNERHRYAYMPFSDGPRHCPAQKLALLEIKLVILAILRKWHVSSLLKPSEIRLISSFSLKSNDNQIELLFSPIN